MDLSHGSMLASFLVSTVGFGFFIYGKKQLRIPQLVTGVALMVYPYFIGSPAWMLGVGAAMLLGLWLTVRAGL
jgi:hypothetical protein